MFSFYHNTPQFYTIHIKVLEIIYFAAIQDTRFNVTMYNNDHE